MSFVYKILLLLGAGILIFNAVYRPENIILYITVGVLLIIGSGTMILREKKKEE